MDHEAYARSRERVYNGKANDEDNLARMLSTKGLMLKNVGRMDEALRLLKEAQVLCRKRNDTKTLESCLHNQVSCCKP